MGVTAEEINVSQSLCVRDGPIKPDTDTLTLKCTKKKRLSISIRRCTHKNKTINNALQWFTGQENNFYFIKYLISIFYSMILSILQEMLENFQP